MKKLWTKFKRWLIHKLGGFTEPQPTKHIYEVQHTIKPIIKLSAAITVPYDFEKEYIIEGLGRQLGKQIEQYMNIRECASPTTFETSYLAEIEIVKGEY